jgi:hypothetical protein
MQEVLAVLPELQQLRHLSLTNFQGETAAADYAAVTASSHLTALQLCRCNVPPAAEQYLFPAGRLLPHLRKLDVSNCGFVTEIDSQGRVEWWEFETYAGRIQPDCAESVSRFVACCPQLEELGGLVVAAGVAAADLQPLLQLTALTSLSVSGVGWTDEVVEHILAKLIGEVAPGSWCICLQHTRLYQLSWSIAQPLCFPEQMGSSMRCGAEQSHLCRSSYCNGCCGWIVSAAGAWACLVPLPFATAHLTTAAVPCLLLLVLQVCSLCASSAAVMCRLSVWRT